MSPLPKSVVYIKFSGPGRGLEGIRRVMEPAGGKPSNLVDAIVNERPQSDSSKTPGRTMSATFSRAEVCRLFELSDGRLRYWDKSEFLAPSGHDGRKRCYTFQDLISIRSALALLDGGLSVQKTRKILEQLKRKLPTTPHPLGRLRITSDAKTVVISEEDHEFEAASGQLLMDFSVASIENEIVTQLPSKANIEKNRTAYDWYLEGCRLDEDEEMLAQAEEAYHRAVHLDPGLANAYTNLGNLRYRAGAVIDAKALYSKAVEVDVNQPEAHYNLGFLEFEDGDLDSASRCFQSAVELDPTFADAHFNLAMTMFRLDEEDTARDHWRKYLDLEPSGPWADIARRRLKDVN